MKRCRQERRVFRISKLVILISVLLAPLFSVEAYADDVEVLISGKRLKRDLNIANKSIRPLGQLRKAGFTVQNLSKHLYHLEYQAIWFDEYTQVVANTVWQRFSLHPNTGKGIVSVGKTPDSKSVVFQMRLPDDESIKGKYLWQNETWVIPKDPNAADNQPKSDKK